MRPLEHEGEIADEAVVVVIPHVPAAKAHAAALHVPEPRHETAQRGHAGAGGADDGHGGLFRDGQGHIMQEGFAVIRKIHVGEGAVQLLKENEGTEDHQQAVGQCYGASK